MDFCEARSGLTFDGYDAFWRWSTDAGLEDFWAAVWDCFDVRTEAPYTKVLDSRTMPGATWFEGARLNYAEHALRPATDRGDEVALVGVSQTRDRSELTWGELVEQVARARDGLIRLGVVSGDRVAAYLPNIPETIVAFLAACSLGATWTSCAPEFGVQAVLDRFTQVEPTVLLAVEGYRYGRHTVSRVDELAAIRAGLPSLRATVVVPYPDPSALDDVVDWGSLLATRGELRFEPVAPDHPLYVLYSSGTTGLPKPIVHGHGGILMPLPSCASGRRDTRPPFGCQPRSWDSSTLGWNEVSSMRTSAPA